MCKAFSGIAVRSGKVYWKEGLDGHEKIKKKFKLDDTKDKEKVGREPTASRGGGGVMSAGMIVNSSSNT